MHYSLALLFLCLLCCSSCTDSRKLAALDAEEQAALDFIAKDPFMRIVRAERHADGTVLVITRQGNKRILYRIDASAGEQPADMIQLVPPHIVYSIQQ